MDKSKRYLVNIVGKCRNCVVDLTKDRWVFCFGCDVLMCNVHRNEERICDRCSCVPDGYDVCIICDCPAICSSELIEGFSDNMAFSESHASPITELKVCDDCKICFIDPKVNYQTYCSVIHAQLAFRGPAYNMYREGNELNYKLIQDGRKQILEHYKKTIPTFILPCIANIIIEYCGFARDIVFEEV